MTPVTCLDATGSVGIKKGPTGFGRPFPPINANPGPCQGCLDLMPRRPADPMEPTTEEGAV